MNAAPLCAAARSIVAMRCFVSVSIVRATNVASAPIAQGSGFDTLLPEFRGRGILPFGEPVDAVVEEHDLHIHIAPQDMQQVIATNTEGIAIPRDHPYHQIRPAGLEPRGNGGCTAVNGVEAIRIHIVWEAAGTPNARNKDYFLPWHP